MKLALIYDKDDHKLQDTSYSWVYKGMLDALVRRFDKVTHIHDDCYAPEIDADVIIFYDVHATHHIRIDGIKSHPAIKMEYVSDPNQEEMRGVFRQFNRNVHKLGRRQRVGRFFERGLDYVICPFRDGYHQWLGEYMGSDADRMLLYFPLAPAVSEIPLQNSRKPEILANGSTADGGKHIYDFRRWAFTQPSVTNIPHWISDKSTPSGQDYMKFLAGYKAALALHDYFPVPKYFEIPMAGCVTFAQHYPEYEDLGFKDYETCIYVTKDNFEAKMKNFLADPDAYQKIAEAGKDLMMNDYTADHFAEFIYNRATNDARAGVSSKHVRFRPALKQEVNLGSYYRTRH